MFMFFLFRRCAVVVVIFLAGAVRVASVLVQFDCANGVPHFCQRRCFARQSKRG